MTGTSNDVLETDAIPRIVECLLAGGVVLIPTDTVYGLAVHPERHDAVHKLYRMKERPSQFNLPIMVADARDLVPLGIDINKSASKLFGSTHIPGPLTLAVGFKNDPNVPWLAGRIEVAIRIPDDARMLEVLKSTGPLLVTSANKHGNTCGEQIVDILEELSPSPDLVIDGGVLQTVPSTLVNCRVQPPVVEREGCIPASEIKSILDL